MCIIDKSGAGISDGLFKGKYFSCTDMDEIISGSYEILVNVGISVLDSRIQKRLSSLGFAVKGDRVLIEVDDARRFLEDARAGYNMPEYKPSAKTYPLSFDGAISSYSQYYEHPESGEILPFDTPALVQMARYIETCSRQYGFTPTVPGYPNDVPPVLESLVKYKIAVENCHAGWPLEPTSVLAAEYLFEMAEVMGQPMKQLPVYMATPLRLGGESFDIAMEFKNRLDSVIVYSLPSFGATTPLSISMAFALSLAEVLGGAILVRELTGLKVDFGITMAPFDFHTLNMVFGSPEKLLFEWMSADFEAQLFQKPLEFNSVNIHTWAKKAGIQAAVEKGTLMMAGALNGATSFYCIGTLGLDEVFSPLELILDLEIMKHVSKIVAGMEVDPLPGDLLAVIRQGLDRGYVGSDLTLDNHQKYIWYPTLFDRQNTQTWLRNGSRDLIQTVRDIVLKNMNSVTEYELEPLKMKTLNEIYARAVHKVGG